MIDLLKELIQAESTAEAGEVAAANVVAARFRRSSIDAHVDVWDDKRANVIARGRSARRRPALLFVCHLDVVAPGEAKWTYPPFAAVEADGKVFGRGAADMKGGLAAAVTAICRIAESGVELAGDIVFLGAAGEETDSAGANRFIDQEDRLPDLAGIIIPEPTGFAVVTAHRGLLWLQITTKGKAAHSSAPQLGVNAILAMKSVLDKLADYKVPSQPHKLLGGCSMSINTISGGKALNIVPDECTIGIDIRTLPGQNHADIIGDLQVILDRLKVADTNFKADIAVVRGSQAMETDANCEFVKDFLVAVGAAEGKAVGFTTDGPQFVSLGVPIVIFGPGNPELCHKADEYIDTADVERAVEYYRKVILTFLAG
jgi:succinyl-diaminopimelate desuccinylase